VTASCHVAAMPTADLDRIGSRGVDVGNAVVVTVNQNEGGEAAVGEHVALVAHQPARVGGPYAEVGPVFIHANSLRGGYDREGWARSILAFWPASRARPDSCASSPPHGPCSGRRRLSWPGSSSAARVP